MTLNLLQLNRGVVSFWRGGGVKLLSTQIRFSSTLITAVLLLISPCSQSGCRQTNGGWRIDSVYCIARGGGWRTVLPVVSLHLPSLPPISTAQQLASHLATGKWYSARNVWEEMAGYGAGLSRGRASDKAC